MYRILLLLLLLIPNLLGGQNLFDIQGNKHKIEIPFRYENRFMLVDIKLENFIPLTFIFDTGSDRTVLAKKVFTDLLSIKYERTFQLIGADLSTELIAYLAKGVDINIGNLKARKRHLLVLKEDYFLFDKYVGTPIDGILGADFFNHFVVEINYKKQVITLHTPRHFKVPKKFGQYKVQKKFNKAYLKAEIQTDDSLSIPCDLLIDSGAGLGLSVYTKIHPDFHLPENVVTSDVGIGLGGIVEGYLGRVKRFQLDDLYFDNVITTFQILPSDVDSLLSNSRDGIIGNALLERFHVFLDFDKEFIYLKPTKNYNRAFKMDRSGLVLAASGSALNKFTIVDIIKNSPAAKAGLKTGDQIISINRFPCNLLSLSTIQKKLQKKVGKSIRLVVKRQGKRHRSRFKLIDLI